MIAYAVFRLVVVHGDDIKLDGRVIAHKALFLAPDQHESCRQTPTFVAFVRYKLPYDGYGRVDSLSVREI